MLINPSTFRLDPFFYHFVNFIEILMLSNARVRILLIYNKFILLNRKETLNKLSNMFYLSPL